MTVDTRTSVVVKPVYSLYHPASFSYFRSLLECLRLIYDTVSVAPTQGLVRVERE